VTLNRFDRAFFDGHHHLTRIGSGSIGGKAAGLRRVDEDVLDGFDSEVYPGFEVAVPRSVVLTTEVFDAFMECNDFTHLDFETLSDQQIAHTIQRGEIPPEFVGDLRALIMDVHSPLAVRSSSLLEDALDHPFAGVYGTKMIPNSAIEEDLRFRHLVEAVSFVYSTMFFSESRSYLGSIGKTLDDERMAVVIQEIVGRRCGDRFYPCVSGVARSHNFYPTGHASPRDGVVTLALGLGKTIVDGGLSWS